ncbi:MAG: hypothetical protein JNL21_25800 [Myxococcales bacterium]|nr:hypothetical protein [Myxococcales bacterium]
MRLLGLFALASTSLLAAFAFQAGCNTYGEDLIGAGGSGSTSTTGTGNNQGGENEGGGQSACDAPTDCPGMDGECGTRTCEKGLCGVDAAAAGTPTSNQTPGDCKTSVCDGDGQVDIAPDDADIEADDEDCTVDTCADGSPVHTPVTEGSPCTGPFNAKVCNAVGVCVECIDGSDCLSGSCTQEFTCAPASCNDGIENNGESDIDCGGNQCPKCLEGDDCNSPNDCLGGICSGGTCQPSCTDMTQNGNETAVDCGGSCAPCAVGLGCATAGDCQSGVCSGTCGEYQLLISELWPRGPGGGNDDFVEIYNPLSVPVTLPSSAAMDKVEIVTRAEGSASYSVKWTANGQTIPARGHLLLVGSAYSRATAADDPLLSGFPDEISLVLRRGATTLDAACINVGTNNFDGTFICEGPQLTYVGSSNNTDRSIERLPGGAAGNATDTGNTSVDFVLITPSAPQNLQSPATP